MVKRALTLLTSILIALPLLMPFNIYADSATIVGTDVSLISTNLLSEENWTVSDGTKRGYYNQFIYHVTVQLDNNYVGYLVLRLQGAYYNDLQSGITTNNYDVSRRVFINGDKAEFNFNITTYYNTDPLLRNTTNGHPNASIVDQGVTLLSELDSIQQIIDILTDLYNSNDQIEGLLNDQLAQLQLVVSNTSLANQYLEFISKYRQYNMPLEFYSSVSYLLNKYDTNLLKNYNEYNIPIFNINSGDRITSSINVQQNGNNYSRFVLVILTSRRLYRNSWTNSIVPSFTNFNTDIFSERILGEYYLYTIINTATFSGNSRGLYFNCNDNCNLNILLFTTWSKQLNYMPLSTDVSLLVDIPNKLIYDLNLIANGTTESQSAADSSQSANEQLQSDSNTLFQQEDNFKSDMNNAMQNVNNTFRLQDMGTKFVTSAQWVRTQYEQLTNNTPFASLITFSLITGLALILLGKVYK